MELMDGGDMDVYIREQGRPYMIDRVKEIGGQLISGLKYLHDCKIIHQDLKPQNILFSGDYEKVKLIDLGVSNHLDKTKATRKAGHGTPRYMSPEQLDGKLSFKCDIWALGCVLLQFSTGVKPFEDVASEVVMCLKIFQGCSPLDYALENFNSETELIQDNEDFKEILKMCFKNDYTQRPSAEQLFENPFFSGYTTKYF